MRRWLAFGAVAIALAGGSVWYFGSWSRTTNDSWVADLVEGRVVNGQNEVRDRKNDGDAEVADAIEPLVVENSVPAPALPASLPELEAPPVYLTSGMKQAPRPDAEPGAAPRMPYLDEVVILPWPLEPWARILEELVLSKLGLFEHQKDANPVEEAENKEVTPPVEPPLPLQVPDYHHQYPSCPYTGGHCPAPYPYYPRR
jgi:hypothetical protein